LPYADTVMRHLQSLPHVPEWSALRLNPPKIQPDGSLLFQPPNKHSNASRHCLLKAGDTGRPRPGPCHRSNGIYFVVDRFRRAIVQRCGNDVCRKLKTKGLATGGTGSALVLSLAAHPELAALCDPLLILLSESTISAATRASLYPMARSAAENVPYLALRHHELKNEAEYKTLLRELWPIWNGPTGFFTQNPSWPKPAALDPESEYSFGSNIQRRSRRRDTAPPPPPPSSE
jgi:hypothetical protein